MINYKLKAIMITVIAIIMFSGCVEKETVIEKEETEVQKESYDSTEQIALGAQYLEEIRYEEALATYNSILLMAGDNPDAYLGIAEVYLRQGEYDTALEYAQKGYETTGDTRLLDMVDMIESGNIVDSKGRMLRMVMRNGDGEIRWWHQFFYDKDGRKKEITHYDANGNLKGKIECEYNKMGNPIISYGYKDDTGELSIIRMQYQDSLCVQEDWYTLQEALKYSYTYEYDKYGLCIKESEYDSGRNLEGYWKYEYNESGKEIRRDYYKAEGILLYYQTWEYNEFGKTTRYSEYSADGSLNWCEISEYAQDGELFVRKVYDENGDLLQVYTNE